MMVCEVAQFIHQHGGISTWWNKYMVDIFHNSIETRLNLVRGGGGE